MWPCKLLCFYVAIIKWLLSPGEVVGVSQSVAGSVLCDVLRHIPICLWWSLSDNDSQSCDDFDHSLTCHPVDQGPDAPGCHLTRGFQALVHSSVCSPSAKKSPSRTSSRPGSSPRRCPWSTTPGVVALYKSVTTTMYHYHRTIKSVKRTLQTVRTKLNCYCYCHC